MPSDYHEQQPMSPHAQRSDLGHDRPPSSKPGGGTRFLVLVLQVGVMAVALLLFFLFAGIAALVLVHLFVAGRALRRRGGSGVARKAGGGPGISPSELKRLPCARYLAKGRPSADCAVCLESLREGECVRSLPSCRHLFHKCCIDKWLIRSTACPICRASIGTSDRSSASSRR